MAQRFQFKRSSITGKRPAPEYLEAGEIALNTNSEDPGLYFEANDASIVKVGPTAISPVPPLSQVGYGHGESWYDTSTGNIRTYDSTKDEWLKAVSPIHGGTTSVVYVGSEYLEASDSIENDGTARPYVTINRACMEIARRSALLPDRDQPYTGRFAIILLPGRNVVYNEPGISGEQFFADKIVYEVGEEITADDFRLFNPESGGMILPRGASIVGYEQSKTIINPTFYPKWTRFTGDAEKSAEENPRTSIVKLTGNASLSDVTFKDKISEVYVTDIEGEPTEPAICVGLTPHGFRSLQVSDTKNGVEIVGDEVSFDYIQGVEKFYEENSTISELERYYVKPIDSHRFYLLTYTGEYILRNQLPEDPAVGSAPRQYIRVNYALKTHHRLSGACYVTQDELQEYYNKIQRAFSKIDVYSTNQNNFRVVNGETTIAVATPEIPTAYTDTLTEMPAKLENCALVSNFGLCGITMDGDSVDGLKTITVKNVTLHSFQNDPTVYDIYYEKEWMELKEAYALAVRKAPQDVTNSEALLWMANVVEIRDMRYYYGFRFEESGRSSGLPDDFQDTRHYGILVKNKGNIEATLAEATGFAINYWAQSGGEMDLINAGSSFCAEAIRSEGFAGIGTAGGADRPDKGFRVAGIRCPLAITKDELTNPANHKEQYFNTGIFDTSDARRLRFHQPLDFTALQPYTIRPGSIFYARQISTGNVLKAYVGVEPAFDGTNADLQIDREYYLYLDQDKANDFLDVDPKDIQMPYIRRFLDPRLPHERDYSLWVKNTSGDHRPPQAGAIFRLAEKPGAGRDDILVFGKQLDPGENGGWNHVFSVVRSTTSQDGDNPNVISTDVIPSTTTGSYYINLKLCDNHRPWIDPKRPRIDALDLDRRLPRGAFVTYEDRIFYARENDLRGLESYLPTDVESVWEHSKTWDISQPIEDALMGSFTTSSGDAAISLYNSQEKNTYARGLAIENENYTLSSYIDYDDGTETFGLDDGDFVNSEVIDPEYGPSKLAVVRFLELLGFGLEDILSFLTPKKWAERNIPIENLPDLANEGYAKGKLEWPCEFNKMSLILASNHNWQWPGYVNYSKGLPKYQTSPLPKRQRFDATSTEVWGGEVFLSGQNNSGKFVFGNISLVRSDGRNAISRG